MNLGVDIVDEILSRLPVKSLIRFKVVCKHWYSHIHSDCFIANHLKNQNTNKKALICYHANGNDFTPICIAEEKEDDDDEDEDDSRKLFLQHQQYHIKDYIPLDSIKHYSKHSKFVSVIGTCNGLVCLDYTAFDGHNSNFTYNKVIFLWNPATRDLKTLPSCESQCLPPGTYMSWSDHVAFGFDSTSNDYKVIRVLIVTTKNIVNQAMIYSLSTNSWRELDCSNVSMEIQALCKLGYNSILLSDKVYWLIHTFDISINSVLLSFDMDKEVFQKIPLPSEHKYTYLFTLHDSIALVRIWTTAEMRLEIWSRKELEKGRASWIKVLNIGLASGIARPLGFWKCKNCNDFLFLSWEYKYELNRKYNIEMKGIRMNNRDEIKDGKTMTIKMKNDIHSTPYQVLTYVESLVSVNRS